MKTEIRSAMAVLGVAGVFAIHGCSSTTSNTGDEGTGGYPAFPGTGGFVSGTGGALPPGTGGVLPGTGGALPGTGGSTAGTGGSTTGTGGSTADCTPPSTPLDPSSFPECPQCTGKGAHCVPNSVVTTIAPDQINQLAPCDDKNVCVPDTFIQTMGKYNPPTCSSIQGGAGRCLSSCIGAVAALGSFLPKATCGENELCAPCTDPRTGKDTGACSLACDTGPKEPSVVFKRCCTGDTGICVPPELVQPEQQKALAQSTCDTGTLCAPEKFADGAFKPKVCKSVADAEGRCVSKCVDLVSKQAELLPQDVCDADELCAPCTDPRSGETTGACTLNGDKPTEPPVIFDKQCCDTTGLCVPKTAVPARYSTLLPADNCAGDGGGADWVCAPKLKLNDINAPLPKCQVLIAGLPVPAGDPNQFGACIPKCIADAQIANNPLNSLGLAQSDCQSGWLCAPCVSPLDQKRTGACD